MDTTTEAVQAYIARQRRSQEDIIIGLVHRLNNGFSDMNVAVHTPVQFQQAHHIFNSQTNWIKQLGDAFAKYQSLAELADYYIPSYK